MPAELSNSIATASRFDGFACDPVTLARRLLGQRLVRLLGGERVAGVIVEVEAYLGTADRAAHTHGGRRTARNESMYLAGGHAYVYLIYGMHHCLNVVCGKRDEGVAVLVRALQPTEGIEGMYSRRAGARQDRDLCSGPAKLTQALMIDRRQDGVDLRRDNSLWIERSRHRALPPRLIERTPRIGVEYAGEWAERPLRFCVGGSAWVSHQRSMG